jgi:hypothetical protein
MEPIILPDGFEKLLLPSAALFGASGVPGTDAVDRLEVTERVLARAKRISHKRQLTGGTVDELQKQIYGGPLLWITLWRYRSLIWFVAKLIAQLAFRRREENNAGHTTEGIQK